MNEAHNGHEKAFSLTRPKTPDELARDSIRKSVPEFRRAVSMLEIPMQAKWLFAQLSDDSFLFEFGGDGFGTIITTVKDIATRYHHTRDSISLWLATLSELGVIWLERDTPFVSIHLSAVVPPPSHKATAIQRVKARAGHGRFVRAGNVVTDESASPVGQKTPKSQQNRHAVTTTPARRDDNTGTPCRQHRHAVTTTPARRDDNTGTESQFDRHGVTTTPARRDDNTGTACRQHRHGVPATPVSDPQNIQPGTVKNAPWSSSPEKQNQVLEGEKASPPPQEKENEAGGSDKAFENWCKQWRPDTFRDKIERELSRMAAKLRSDPDSDFWRKRADFLRCWLDGGKPEKKHQPVRLAKKETTPPPSRKVSVAESQVIAGELAAMRATFSKIAQAKKVG